jgi:hypothetical protein
MRAMGHMSPQMTFGAYAAAMDWGEGEADRLRALVEGVDWVATGTKAAEEGIEGIEHEAA